MVRITISTLALAGLLIGLNPHSMEGQSVPSFYQFLENRQEAGIFAGYAGQGTGRFGFGPSPGLSLGARYGIHLGGPSAWKVSSGICPRHGTWWIPRVWKAIWWWGRRTPRS